MSLPEPSTWNRRLGAGLLVSSLCLLALELTLSRIFSVLMWYHFVSLIVSLALFGITVSGLAVFLAPRRFPREAGCRQMCSGCVSRSSPPGRRESTASTTSISTPIPVRNTR